MRVERADGYYVVHDGEYNQYFDTADKARAYVSLVGIFSAQYALNKKYSVEYHYDPPPGWMRK